MTIIFRVPGEPGSYTYRLDDNTVSTSTGEHSVEMPQDFILGQFVSGRWEVLRVEEPDEESFETDCSNGVEPEPEGEVGGAIASDGGSSSYYDIPVPDWFVDRLVERAVVGDQGYIKTEELIEVIFQNDFDAGNAFKSLIRLWGAFNGAGKAGNSVSYDKRKIEYSLDKLEQRFERQGEAE